MSDASYPTVDEITRALEQLALRLSTVEDLPLNDYPASLFRVCVTKLKRFTPGFDLPRDPKVAKKFIRSARAAARKGDHRQAVAQALHGLSDAPHNSILWRLAAMSCFELGGVESAIRLLQHACWINPGYEQARQDLEALEAFFGDEADSSE